MVWSTPNALLTFLGLAALCGGGLPLSSTAFHVSPPTGTSTANSLKKHGIARSRSSRPKAWARPINMHMSKDPIIGDERSVGVSLHSKNRDAASRAVASCALSIAIAASAVFGTPAALAAEPVAPASAAEQQYDGFADYAKDNQMEKSDVGCFVKQCGDQTKALFSNPRGIKGVSCLGRCKGEQACATRCFAEYGSEDLNNWLSCTIEDNECVKVPKNVDNSAENVGYRAVVQKFDPSSIVGTWYKTDGLNPNYDLFDCQTNTFTPSADADDASNLDLGITLRVTRPEGGFWDNSLTEHMVVEKTDVGNPSKPTMHTEGKMYGLTFAENWYIVGESDGKKDVPPFKLVAYKGHTLQGNYEGAFVMAKESRLPAEAVPAVRKAAAEAGLDFDQFTRIDNTCPTTTKALNDETAGTGTSTTDWIDLVIGEGGVIDWVVPGWRGEYKKA